MPTPRVGQPPFPGNSEALRASELRAERLADGGDGGGFADYAVNGTGIPDVDFDVGESYSGLLSISDDLDDENKLFFWFFPSTNPAADQEIVIWLNGGVSRSPLSSPLLSSPLLSSPLRAAGKLTMHAQPGCSSLEGLLQENGPFAWQDGTYAPVPNPWGWNTLSNMVWVEQPVGTGYSTGTPTATGEEDVAAQFLGFWRNFVDLFGLQGSRVYVTGESYAGAYVPYISAAMLDADEPAYYNMSGMMIYDPVIGNDAVQDSVTVVPFVDYHNNLMTFNDSYSAYLHQQHVDCGYANYSDTYLHYPPPGPQPTDYNTPSFECDLWDQVYSEMFSLNPCFDVYNVAITCPLLWDVLGFPGSLFYTPAGAGPVYFERDDVKAALHAPADATWEECSSGSVFVGGDSSVPTTWAAIPQVIEATQNVIIGHGVLDMILLPNGTLLAIQNMTWGGQLGFQSPPVEPFFVPYHDLSTASSINFESDPTALATMAPAGVLGATHSERGLTWVGVDRSGHMVPQYQPSAAYRHLEVLLGRVDSLSSTAPFTTAPDYAQPDPDSLGSGTGPAYEGGGRLRSQNA